MRVNGTNSLADCIFIGCYSDANAFSVFTTHILARKKCWRITSAGFITINVKMDKKKHSNNTCSNCIEKKSRNEIKIQYMLLGNDKNTDFHNFFSHRSFP